MYYYPHHIGDFLRDTSRLSDSQCMAYLRLIWSYYDQEEPLPNQPEKLAFQIGADPNDVRLILEHYFTLDGDVYRHTRCDQEIAAFREKSSKARRSAETRWKYANALRTNSERIDMQPQSNRSTNAMRTHTESDANALRPHSKRNTNAPVLDANQEPIKKEYTPQVADLLPGVDPAVLKDFVALRKKLRAPITEVAAKGLIREAEKAGITLTQALTICCERSWRGFNADWLKDKKAKSDEFDWDEALRGAA